MLEFITTCGLVHRGPAVAVVLIAFLTSVREQKLCLVQVLMTRLTFSVQIDRCLTMGRAHGHLRAKVVALTEPQAAAALARRG